MTTPYSMDLRKRVVAMYAENPDLGFRGVAEVFKVGEATVNRWVQRERRGELAPRAMGGPRRPQAFSAEELEFIRQTLVELPDSTLREVQAAFLEEFGREHHLSTFHDAIRNRLGFTRKRGVRSRRNVRRSR
jgi:transposase